MVGEEAASCSMVTLQGPLDLSADSLKRDSGWYVWCTEGCGITDLESENS